MSAGLREITKLLEERAMLRALERGPEAKLKWLRGQREQVAALLAEIEKAIEEAEGVQR